ncbi:MAG TPA: MarR family transcriptional regulator, partial [Dehalococcoidia bacterium]|nr:MarR family transcriptional regulator [Dehalococcoidia bacterium]
TAGELSERTGLTSGATTRLIDRLERVGYVRRCADAKDRRCVIIEPVPENLEKLVEFFQPMADTMTKLWSKLHEHELEVIIKFLRRNNAALAEINAVLRARPTTGAGD